MHLTTGIGVRLLFDVLLQEVRNDNIAQDRHAQVPVPPIEPLFLAPIGRKMVHLCCDEQRRPMGPLLLFILLVLFHSSRILSVQAQFMAAAAP